jgi:hypothetical protein
MMSPIHESTEITNDQVMNIDISNEINEGKIAECVTPPQNPFYSSSFGKIHSPKSITSCLSPCKQSLTTQKKERKVSFHNVVSLILIPTIQEYREAELLRALWWNEQEFCTFREETNRNIQQFMISKLTSKSVTPSIDSSPSVGSNSVTPDSIALKKAQAKTIMRLYFDFFLSEIENDFEKMKSLNDAQTDNVVRVLDQEEGEGEEDFQSALLTSVDSVDSEEMDNRVGINDVSVDSLIEQPTMPLGRETEPISPVVLDHQEVHDDSVSSSFPFLEISLSHSVSLNLTRILTINGLFFLFNQQRRQSPLG